MDRSSLLSLKISLQSVEPPCCVGCPLNSVGAEFFFAGIFNFRTSVRTGMEFGGTPWNPKRDASGNSSEFFGIPCKEF